MAYFKDWFGDRYFAGWFDGPETIPAVGSDPGASKSVILGTVAPRPPAPLWRQIEGAQGTAITEIRTFLSDTLSRDHLWGNHVEVTFPGAGTAVRVDTGLGGTAKGYKVVRANADIRVWDATPQDVSGDRGVLWLQASGAGKVTLYVY